MNAVPTVAPFPAEGVIEPDSWYVCILFNAYTSDGGYSTYGPLSQELVADFMNEAIPDDTDYEEVEAVRGKDLREYLTDGEEEPPGEVITVMWPTIDEEDGFADNEHSYRATWV